MRETDLCDHLLHRLEQADDGVAKLFLDLGVPSQEVQFVDI
jgi:hypothetical protein